MSGTKLRILGILFAAIFVSASSFAIFVQNVDASIGVTPAGILDASVFENGSRHEKVTLTRSKNINSTGVYEASFWGPGAEYLSGSDKVVIPAGDDSAEYAFQFDAGNAPLGEYDAFIDFLPVVSDSGAIDDAQSMITNRIGVTLAVSFGVTIVEVKAFEVRDAVVGKIEEGTDLQISYLVINHGNRNWRPEELHFVVKDEIGDTVLDTSLYEESIDIVEPGMEEVSNVSIPHNLEAGKYSLTFEALEGGEVIYRLSKRLEIFPEGTFLQKGELTEFSIDQSEYNYQDEIFVSALFKNTGDTSYNASLVTISFQDNSVIGMQRTDGVFVGPGEEVSYSTSVKPIGSGNFRLLGLVEYGENSTPPKKVDFSVSSSAIPIWIIIPISIIPLLFIALWVAGRLRGKKK
ncbi:MAG: hypothetical protein Q8P30_03345 [Candidatus Uhrbacteria bacterium]|nr:hypothetical protein [Candidatus Uhrbacteria bacterium]